MPFGDGIIRPIAIAVVRRGDDVLVERGYDKVKDEYFYRPIGGGINFGETAQDALKREYKEEIGVDINVGKLIDINENIFMFNGKQGHEIVFVYEASLVSEKFYEQEVFPFLEESKSEQYAQWVSLDTRIYPEIIKTYQSQLGEENV